MKIFLGDLVHTWNKVSVWTVPLNIAFLTAYAKAHVEGAESWEFQLFKDPEKMFAAIKDEKPDVVGLSHYVWNSHLNAFVFQYAKEACPEIITVGGGPNITSLNANEKGAAKFFKASPHCDAYIYNQGEQGFAKFLEWVAAGGTATSLRNRAELDGCLINRGASNPPFIGASIAAFNDLDRIPSPYLSGLLDEFLAQPLIPMLETNRSCPYRCTFCAWGIGTSKLAQFSEERTLAEINYIADHKPISMNMFVTDANFGILERDQTFARELYKTHEATGYPGRVAVQWNKTRPDRVLKAAKEFRGIAEVGASMQSLDPGVLDAVKRKNLNLETFMEMQNSLRSYGITSPLFSELILGLPAETLQTHLDANQSMLDLGARVVNYNLHLLPGTEMETEEQRAKYFRKTGWRMHDNAYGVYAGKKIIEGQEVVLETSSMKESELWSMRFVHFLLEFMWNRRWYHDYLKFMTSCGARSMDLVYLIADAISKDRGAMGELYRRFEEDHALEAFPTFDALYEYWTDEAHFQRLANSEYGKLNFYYIYEIVLDCSDAFDALLQDVTKSWFAEKDTIVDADSANKIVSELLDFCKETRVDLMNGDSLIDQKVVKSRTPVPEWRDSGCELKVLTDALSQAPQQYRFYLDDAQHRNLKAQLAQFDSENKKLMLRKLSEVINPTQLFYRIDKTGGGKTGSGADNRKAAE